MPKPTKIWKQISCCYFVFCLLVLPLLRRSKIVAYSNQSVWSISVTLLAWFINGVYVSTVVVTGIFDLPPALTNIEMLSSHIYKTFLSPTFQWFVALRGKGLDKELIICNKREGVKKYHSGDDVPLNGSPM